MPIGKLDTATVREWRVLLLGNGVGSSEVAKAYRFLRAVLMTAADDQIIPRNPCRIRGAGEEKPEERPVLTVAKVFELADLMPARLRSLVLLATFASLRWGEVAALRRMDLDLAARTAVFGNSTSNSTPANSSSVHPSPAPESVPSPSRKRSRQRSVTTSTSTQPQNPTP